MTTTIYPNIHIGGPNNITIDSNGIIVDDNTNITSENILRNTISPSGVSQHQSTLIGTKINWGHLHETQKNTVKKITFRYKICGLIFPHIILLWGRMTLVSFIFIILFGITSMWGKIILHPICILIMVFTLDKHSFNNSKGFLYKSLETNQEPVINGYLDGLKYIRKNDFMRFIISIFCIIILCIAIVLLALVIIKYSL